MKKRTKPLDYTMRILRNQRKRTTRKPFPPAQPMPLFDDKPWIKMSASNSNLAKFLSDPYTGFQVVLLKEPHQFTTVAVKPRGINKIASAKSRHAALKTTAHIFKLG